MDGQKWRFGIIEAADYWYGIKKFDMKLLKALRLSSNGKVRVMMCVIALTNVNRVVK